MFKNSGGMFRERLLFTIFVVKAFRYKNTCTFVKRDSIVPHIVDLSFDDNYVILYP